MELKDEDFDLRLGKIESVIKQPSFFEKNGLSSEVGYYIFDYDPEYEMEVREEIKRLKNKINSNDDLSFKIYEFDLYDIIIEILQNKGRLEKVFKFEEKKGISFSQKQITRLLKVNSDSNLIVNYIIERTPDNCVVFLTGVGKAYPILRSHNVLNNLHEKLDNVPVVLFFPGKMSHKNLILFNTLENNNFYRALPLISR